MTTRSCVERFLIVYVLISRSLYTALMVACPILNVMVGLGDDFTSVLISVP